MADDKFVTIRVRSDSHARLRRLTALVTRGGWAAIKSSRKDKPSMASLIDEAIDKLEQK